MSGIVYRFRGVQLFIVNRSANARILRARAKLIPPPLKKKKNQQLITRTTTTTTTYDRKSRITIKTRFGRAQDRIDRATYNGRL